MPRPGIEPWASAWLTDTLPRRYKCRLFRKAVQVYHITNVQNFMKKKKMFYVVDFASDLHLNSFVCSATLHTWLEKKKKQVHKMLKLVS